MAVTNYRVMETNSKTAGVPGDTAGGRTTLKALPELGAYIAAGH